MVDEITIRQNIKTRTVVNTGSSSIPGTRSSQQDKVFVHAEEGRAIGIVCDGMGGLQGGEIASQAAVGSFARSWKRNIKVDNYSSFLRDEAIKADQLVFEQEDGKGNRLDAGTTVVMAVIQNHDLYWLSIGDSRLYIVRGQEIFAINKPHNYREVLEEKLQNGEITIEAYEKEEHKAEALTSYLGMGNISLMDINEKPFPLQSRDLLLLCSDGLYRSLSDSRILKILIQNRDDIQGAAEKLTAEALGNKTHGQDNTSVVLMEFLIKNK